MIRAAGIEDLIEQRVDGVVARQESLPGKPAPDTFVEDSRRLGIEPGAAAVFEDAQAGVVAGQAGGSDSSWEWIAVTRPKPCSTAARTLW